jgi:high-affinity Fe2+/Pb2+ permease
MISLSMITTFFTIMAIISGLILGVLVYLDNRKARIDAGIAQFRRHIDALSPESRRASVHRETDERWRH